MATLGIMKVITSREQIASRRLEIKSHIDKKVREYRDQLSKEFSDELQELNNLCLKLSQDCDHAWRHDGYNFNQEYEYEICIYCGKHRTINCDTGEIY